MQRVSNVHGVAGGRGRSWLLAAVLAALVVLVATLPVAAVAGSTKLLDPAVSPTAGTPTTTISFAVTYRNREGSPPDHVVVLIDGVAHPMTASGDDWKGGVRHTYATTLPVGVHDIRFRGAGRDKFVDEVDAGSVTIVAPATPSPSPSSTPVPLPTPPAATPTPPPRQVSPPPTAATPSPGTPSPATTPRPATAMPATPSDSPSGATPPPAAGGGAAPGAGNGAAPDAGGGAGPDPSGGPGTPAGPAVGGPGDPTAGGSNDPTAGGSAGPTPRDGRSGLLVDAGGWGDLARALEALGLDGPQGPLMRTLPVIVGTTGAVTLLTAFMFFGKKRRDGEPPAPDEVLSASAARGSGLPAARELVPETVTLAPGPAPAAPVDAEATMPRWRRPSLLEARKADPLRSTAAPAPRLSFEHGLVGPLDGRERRVIRYNVVRLLDAPDELRSAEIGFLDQGDEVQLLERSGAYWLVLCPDGRRGWLHKMTLGDLVDEPPAPGPRETWATQGKGSEEVDEDVLEAFLAARRGA